MDRRGHDDGVQVRLPLPCEADHREPSSSGVWKQNVRRPPNAVRAPCRGEDGCSARQGQEGDSASVHPPSPSPVAFTSPLPFLRLSCPLLLSSTPVPIPPAAGSSSSSPPLCMCGVLLVMLPTVPANSTISALLLLVVVVVVVVFLVVELGYSGLRLSSWRLSSTTEVTPLCSLLMR